jgi:hypothetical protein
MESPKFVVGVEQKRRLTYLILIGNKRVVVQLGCPGIGQQLENPGMKQAGLQRLKLTRLRQVNR